MGVARGRSSIRRAAVVALLVVVAAGCSQRLGRMASDDAGAATPRWVELGPRPMEYRFTFSDVASGRITSVLVLEGDAILVGTASGGIWRTEDGGTSWTCTTDDLPNLCIGALARDPSRPDVLYAGSGEGEMADPDPSAVPKLNRAPSYGIGVYRSTDGGRSWALLPGSRVTEGMGITRLAVDPLSSDRIFVATQRSPVTGATPLGLAVSEDAGATFTAVRSLSGLGVFDVACHPARPSVWLASAASSTGYTGGRVLRSGDGGRSWVAVNGLPARAFRISIAFAPGDPDRAYALVGKDDIDFDGLYGSANGGRDWMRVGPPITPVGDAARFCNAIAVDPGDVGTVYLGAFNMIRVSGLDPATPGAGAATALTGDPGQEIFPDGEPDDDTLFENSPHLDHHALAFDAAGRLLDATDGGLWRLDSPSTTGPYPQTRWTNLNGRDGAGRNLGTIQLTGISLHPRRPDVVFGGTQDNGTIRYDGSLTWIEDAVSADGPIGGDGGRPLIDALHPEVVWIQTQFGRLFRSVNGGARYASLADSMRGIDESEAVLFYAPITQVVDERGVTVAVGRTRVWETSTGPAQAVRWRAASDGSLDGGARLSSLAYAPGHAAVLYAGTERGHVFVRTRAGGAFSERSAGLPARYVSSILVDGAEAYCTVIGTGTGHVFRSTGGAWTDVSGDLADLPVYDIVRVDGRLMVATQTGVYASDDGGATWIRFGAGLPSVIVFDLEVDASHGILAAATHGRGLWEIPIREGVTIQPARP